MPSGDGLIPVLVNLDGQTKISQVALVDENIESFEELATQFYTALRPGIPEFYLEQGERHVTKMWVQWDQTGGSFPRETEIFEGNIRATLRLVALRGGVDMIRLWLNAID